MFSGERSSETGGALIASFGGWEVREFTIGTDELQWLWAQMQKYRTLFTDLTRGDFANFLRIVTQPDSFWMSVSEEATGTIVGILYVTEMGRITDAEVHIVFFDHKPSEKLMVCKLAMQWMFVKFPFHRLTASIPKIYYTTKRLAEAMGFKVEGVRREVYLMQNRWLDEVILGITRAEVLG